MLLKLVNLKGLSTAFYFFFLCHPICFRNRETINSSSGKKHEEHWDILFISRGQDIEEVVLTYFRNKTNRSENSNGHSWIGWIMSANGLVFHPILENSSTTDEGLYDMIRLGGRYTISEDGDVQQYGPLTISCAGPSHVVYGGQVIGRLVAAEAVQVVVGTVTYNPSEDE